MPTEGSALAFSTVFLSKNPPDDRRVLQLINLGKKFFSTGLVKGIEGNLSFRTRLGFIISGTEVPLNALTTETVVEVTRVVYGLNRTSVYIRGQVLPSRETILHAQIYDMLANINAIFHVHDPEIMEKAEKSGILTTTVEQLAGSPELAREAVNLLKLNKNARYFVLKNHGVIALGESMDEASKLIEQAGERKRP